QQRVNGRDLWSTRASLAWEPSDRFRANVIWQHFEEDDNRSRTGKQLCTNDPSRTQIGDTPVVATNPTTQAFAQARFSQGCQPGSLYDDAAYGVPNGASFAFMFPANRGIGNLPGTGRRPGAAVNQLRMVDPFEGVVQSR